MERLLVMGLCQGVFLQGTGAALQPARLRQPSLGESASSQFALY